MLWRGRSNIPLSCEFTRTDVTVSDSYLPAETMSRLKRKRSEMGSSSTSLCATTEMFEQQDGEFTCARATDKKAGEAEVV